MKKLAYVCMVVLLVSGCVKIPETLTLSFNVEIRHIVEDVAKVEAYAREDAGPRGASGPGGDTRDIDLVGDIMPSYLPHAERMRRRGAELAELMKAGTVGEANSGLLVARPGQRSPTGQAKALFDAENHDRQALFVRIVEERKDTGVTLEDVGLVYGFERATRAETGTWIQVPREESLYDKFLKTDVGQRLGDQATPGAWVKVK